MFKWHVEECGLWALMFNDDTGKPKREAAIQLLFAGLLRAYCDAHGVPAEREVQLGRGLVDFAFSGNNLSRVLLDKRLVDSDYVLRLRALPMPRYGQAPHVFALGRRGRTYLSSLVFLSSRTSGRQTRFRN